MNTEIEKKLWKKVHRYAPILKIVPFIKMLSVCNNLSFGKVDEKSDIDLFVIAKTGRLFTVRAFITFLFYILGVRRNKNKITGRFCLSFFIDEENMDLSKVAIIDDIYLVYWLKAMIPVLAEEDAIDKFLEENKWAKRFFENENDFFIRHDFVYEIAGFLKIFRKLFKLLLKGTFGDFIENYLKKWQLKRAQKKILNIEDKFGILVQDHILKFHNIDRRREYKMNWINKYGKSQKITDEKFNKLFL